MIFQGCNQELPSFLILPNLNLNPFVKSNIHSIKENDKKIITSKPVHYKDLMKFHEKYRQNYHFEENQNLIYPQIPSNGSCYLGNINEYDIKESYNVNPKRIIKLNISGFPSINPVNDRKYEHSTKIKYNLQKWPLFYEK